MTSYRFIVPGPPIPKARPRLGKRGVFTPKRTQNYETKVKLCAYTAGVKRLEGEVCLSVWFYLPDRRKRDTDNLVKGILDACNGVAWRDDDQVTEIHAVKEYDPANPRCVVHVEKRG